MILKGFKKCCISDAVDETDNDMLWNDSEGDGNVKNECEEDEVTACEDEHSTMKIKTSDTDLYRQIQYHVCNICILMVKYFLLAEILSGCCLGFGYTYFLLVDMFYICSCFRSESSYTQVNMIFSSGFQKSIVYCMDGPMTVIAGFSLYPDHTGERVTDKQTVF